MPRTIQLITALFILGMSFVVAAHAGAVTIKRTNFIVGNIACTSCLAAIEDELRSMTGTIGMEANLQKSCITVDHLDTLKYDQIEAAISRLGYPATMEWTATLPEEYVNRFAGQNRSGAECSGNSCNGTGGPASGASTWQIPPPAATIIRTTLKVNNLTCTSCLASIATELSRLSTTYGMNGYLSRGIVIVDHAESLASKRIAAIITDLGYEARVMATNRIPVQKAYKTNPEPGSGIEVSRAGGWCNSSGPCNATSAAWQKFYNRYFTRTNSR